MANTQDPRNPHRPHAFHPGYDNEKRETVVSSPGEFVPPALPDDMPVVVQPTTVHQLGLLAETLKAVDRYTGLQQQMHSLHFGDNTSIQQEFLMQQFSEAEAYAMRISLRYLLALTQPAKP